MSMKVKLGTHYNRSAVVIDPNAGAADVEDKDSKIFKRANNIIGEGMTSRQILDRLYGRK